MRNLLKASILCMSLVVISGQAWSATTSVDHVFTANDIHSSTFHTKLNRDISQLLTGGINNINDANIVNDSLKEADMADEINPRIRTYEGASCAFVYTGLLPSTDSDLTSDISAGTAYPDGYRVVKAAATAKTYTASKWTWVDLDKNGDFQYTELPIGSGTPAVAAYSIRLALVSTDSTTVNTVTDLRTTSCANGPFSNIGSATGESNLDDMLAKGKPIRKSFLGGQNSSGYSQGAYVSWSGHTTFTVTSGSLYINGEYRTASTDITVPNSADDPASSVSGIVSGSIAANTTYNVYAVADQNAVKPFSVSFGESATGLTNYRLIGQIKTDASSLFSSRDVLIANGVSERELVGGYITFNGTGTVAVLDSFNVSGITDDGTGLYTISWDNDFNDANYSLAGIVQRASGAGNGGYVSLEDSTDVTVGAIKISTLNNDGTADADLRRVSIIAIGDTRK